MVVRFVSETPETPEFDLGAVPVDDAILPPVTEPIPNHEASRPKRGRRGIFNPPGDKRDAPPKRERTARKPVTIPKRKGQFVAPLTQMYGTVGILLMPVDPVCAQAIVANAEACAKALDNLAYQNDAVRRVLYSLVQTSAIGVVIAAHAPILFAIAVHHVPAVQRGMERMGQDMVNQMEAQMRAAQPNPDSGDE